MDRLTFDRLQAEVGTWSGRNFPASTDNESFHGICEETGELAAAILAVDAALDEENQEKHAEALREMSDAIGDTTVFLADYAHRRGIVIAEVLDEGFGHPAGTLCRLQDETAMGADTLDDPMLMLVKAVGQLAHARLKARQGIRGGTPLQLAAERGAVGRIAIALSIVCSREGLCYERAVAETWATVKCRDWLANPETGRAPSDAGGASGPAPAVQGWEAAPELDGLAEFRQAVAAPAEPEVYPAEVAIPARSTMPYEVQ